MTEDLPNPALLPAGFADLLPPDAAPQALIRDLANVAGVQSVNLRQTRAEA
jgi:hypothetical protein